MVDGKIPLKQLHIYLSKISKYFNHDIRKLHELMKRNFVSYTSEKRVELYFFVSVALNHNNYANVPLSRQIKLGQGGPVLITANYY